ncbi:MAG: phosphonate ABC transporter substrate-binding protein [Alphaproteobacteria bacterium]|nr:phosphonate ABC transporter substrate-binding protein [Alphaproteobacteria bacterium]
MSKTTNWLAATALATATVVAAGTVSAEEMKEINFGIISTESSQNLRKAWEPLLEDMGEELGVKVNAFFAPDYAGIIEGMRFDKVQVAWYGNKSAMEAVDRANGEVFVQTVDVSGNPGYWSLLLAHKDSPINSLEDALKCDAGYNFGNGDPNSTSGFLVPSYYVFAQNNVDPKTCYKRVVNANHETNALAVANKRVDFATNNTESLSRIEQNNPDAFKDIKIVWKSPLIPSDPLVWRKDLSDDMKARIKSFFLSYGRLGDNIEEELEILAGIQLAPFKDSSNAQLYPIRQLQLFRDRTRIQNDERLSAAEKAERTAVIDAELERLKILAAAETS